MRTQASKTRLDRPWRRPGALRYALARLPGLLHPPVDVYEPPAGTLSVLRDLPVIVRDGTTLRVNVVRPPGPGPFPVLLSAHPYGKDDLPRRRDLAFPGGVREDGFMRQWSRALRGVRLAYRLSEQQQRHPLRDQWWRELVPSLEKITVPALICGSFSDNNLHGRGSIRGWERISSTSRFLYTHRSGKWATFYSPEARSAQLGFFDRYLRGRDVPAPPRIRLEVRESRDVVAGRWLWPRNPLTGPFPATYEHGRKGRCTLHWGPECQARLLVPVIP